MINVKLTTNKKKKKKKHNVIDVLERMKEMNCLKKLMEEPYKLHELTQCSAEGA